MCTATLIYSEAGETQSLALQRDLLSIGRSSRQDLVVRDVRVSRQHAVILRDQESFAVIDQNSTHGTFLNGVRIHRARLNPDDVLHLGSLSGPALRFSLDATDDDSLHCATPCLTPGARAGLSNPVERGLEPLHFLLRAARELNSSGGIEEILERLLQLTLQLTGVERGFVLLQEAGALRVALGLEAGGRILKDDNTISMRAIERALESRSVFTISDTRADHRAAGWPSMLANSIRRICSIPLYARGSEAEPGELLGVLYLDSRLSPGTLSEVDVDLLEAIAAESAALLHNALLAQAEYEARHAREELGIAAKIHSGLMCAALPAIEYAAIEARSVPCRAIGGDFYDALVLEDCVCVTIADVSGKGVSAAIVAATLQGIIHAQMLSGQPLVAIAARLNEFLCERSLGKYATLVMLKLSGDGRLEYLNCGHILPLVVMGEEVTELRESNLAVGLLEDVSYRSASCVLRPGARLLVASDGITEAENEAGEPFGSAGLSALARDHTVEEIVDHVRRYQQPAMATDDCSLLAVRFRGRGPGVPE